MARKGVWCPIHGTKDDTFTAPFAGYQSEPGCTCTMIPSTKPNPYLKKPKAPRAKPIERVRVTTTTFYETWSVSRNMWVPQRSTHSESILNTKEA